MKKANYDRLHEAALEYANPNEVEKINNLIGNKINMDELQDLAIVLSDAIEDIVTDDAFKDIPRDDRFFEPVAALLELYLNPKDYESFN